MKVGMAAGLSFQRGSHRHRVVLGKDTRLSGYMIENAMVAGFCAAGMDVFLLGPIPTPAVAMLARSLRADIGVMSCNPAIGGIGKSHLVREVDALGGAMARATDRAGIQFRVLNARKGPAVQATRAQADRVLYRNAVRQLLEGQDNLSIFQQPVDDLLLEGGRVAGAITQMGLLFRAPRGLKLPVCWKSSSLRKISVSASMAWTMSRLRQCQTGVSTM